MGRRAVVRLGGGSGRGAAHIVARCRSGARCVIISSTSTSRLPHPSAATHCSAELLHMTHDSTSTLVVCGMCLAGAPALCPGCTGALSVPLWRRNRACSPPSPLHAAHAHFVCTCAHDILKITLRTNDCDCAPSAQLRPGAPGPGGAPGRGCARWLAYARPWPARCMWSCCRAPLLLLALSHRLATPNNYPRSTHRPEYQSHPTATKRWLSNGPAGRQAHRGYLLSTYQ